MDDLLRTTLRVDDPSDDVTARSRHRLQRHVLGGATAPRRRIAWLSAGVAVTAAAAVAIAVLPGAPAPEPAPHATQERVTAQDVLLAAAAGAARADDGTGAYWHVRIEDRRGVMESWTAPDGRWWAKGGKVGDTAAAMPIYREQPFSLFGVYVTLEQLRAMPTEPAALRAWIAEALEHSDVRTSAGPLTAEDRETGTFMSLISLVSTVPAPPEVRAAAFRAIAEDPDVEPLGALPGGGQGVLLPGGDRLVVDPATGRVRGTSTYVTADMAIYHTSDPEGARITAEWTDVPPA